MEAIYFISGLGASLSMGEQCTCLTSCHGEEVYSSVEYAAKGQSGIIRRHLTGIHPGKSPTSNGRWPEKDGIEAPRAITKFLIPED